MEARYSPIALASIRALTLYNDALTLSRRGQSIPQLICVGKACDLFTPDYVRCVNVGGSGTEVDWKCETDLPEGLRMGRVQVSCEGWSGPGDPEVLKGSCSLEYRLVHVPKALRNSDSYNLPQMKGWFTSENAASTVFYVLWTALLFFMLYSVIKSCFGGSRSSTTARPPSSPRSSPSNPDSGHGWFPGDHRDNHGNPPPPYTKHQSDATGSSRDSPGGLGFWSGAALGGLGTYLLNRRQDTGANERRPRQYDWERERSVPGPRPSASAGSWGLFSRPGRTPAASYEDRGEGSSDLGSMRRATGFGGSNVR